VSASKFTAFLPAGTLALEQGFWLLPELWEVFRQTRFEALFLFMKQEMLSVDI